MESSKKKHFDYDLTVLSLQGGGALGSYQVGVIKELLEAGYEPDWVVGTSIGAINAAIIAGNKPERRVQKLLDFWEKITWPQWTDFLDVYLEQDSNYDRWKHQMGAQAAIWLGQPGFFQPRVPSPIFAFDESVERISFYETEQLRETLLEFIDFKLLNRKHVRISLGAVEIRSGTQVFFDNSRDEIGPEHIMASGALPPGFPAIKIGDSYFWDGGIVTNTPISIVLNEEPHKKVLAFMIHLFNSEGPEPSTLDGVLKRRKNITYSSEYNQLVHLHREIYSLRHAIFELGKHLPENKRQQHHIKKFLKKGWTGQMALVRFVYPERVTELASMDYNFTKHSVEVHFRLGCNDAKRALEQVPWKEPIPQEMGIAMHLIER